MSAFLPDSSIVSDVVPSPNVDERAEGRPPDMILLHYTGMKTGEAALERLCTREAKVSAHYVVFESGRIVQCGTAREIFQNPSSEYVADFVAHMNPLGVLTARDAMQAASGSHASTVAAEETIQSVMARVMASDAPVGVTEDGTLIGEVTRDTVLARLLDPTGKKGG